MTRMGGMDKVLIFGQIRNPGSTEGNHWLGHHKGIGERGNLLLPMLDLRF